jgi:hypothetical protein
MSGTSRHWLAVSVFVALALLLGGKAVLGERRLCAGDVVDLDIPRDRVLAEALRAGEGVPRWAPGVCGGAPALGAQELALLYPPTILLALVAPERAQGLSLLLHLVLAAGGAFKLARVLGARAEPATLAGLVYAFSGSLLATHVVPMYVRSGAWLPWALAGLAEGGFGLPLLAFLGIYLAGDPLGCVLAAFAGGVVVATSRGVRSLAPFALRLGAVGLASGLLGAAQLFPALLAAAGSDRAAGLSFEEATRFSVWPPELAGLAVPFLFGAHGDGTSWYAAFSPGHDRAWLETCYVGPIALALAASGAGRLRKDPLARCGLALLATFLVLCLGRFTPLWGLVHALPGGAFFRYPAKLLVHATLGLALLAASGLAGVAAAAPEARRRSLVVLGGLAAVGLLGANAVLVAKGSLVDALEAAGGLALDAPRALDALAPRLAHVGFVALGAALVIARPRRRSAWALVALAGVDLALALQPAVIVGHDPLARPALLTGVAAELERQGGAPARILPTDAAAKWMPSELGDEAAYAERTGHPAAGLAGNLGVALGVLSQKGMLACLPLRRDEVWREAAALVASGRIGPAEHAARLGARFVLARGAEVPERAEGVRRLDAGLGERVLLELTSAPPWAHLARAVRYSSGLAETLALLRAEGRPPGEVVVESPEREPVLQGEPAPAHLVPPFGRERFEVALPAIARRSWLVVHESFAPGWSAAIDGTPAPVFPADGMFRAVLVPEGARRVVFSYRAPGAMAGALVSLFAAVALGLVWARFRWSAPGAGTPVRPER